MFEDHSKLTNIEHLDGGTLAVKGAKTLSDVAQSIHYTPKHGEVALIFKIKRIRDASHVMIDHTFKYVELKQRGKVIEEDTTSMPMYVGTRGTLTFILDTQQNLFGEGMGG
ncbi:hypothetical protein FUT69_00635 [Xylella taiwanensis]|uniref:Uncharacterized protein n=1 Tax=Xylella taiwanensis TaxID=1444770 RepID=Z9JKT5_9GAMM|nr:hypothetical protein [Xylella taiwanensis]AXI83140.1 hypothetical protein AB672_03880 [Xylella taiwanensis]EWS78804.1 hypothetical protein AF72_04325 [Xylella taiwanensis]MCD8456189.1 hypothetical protein [Xylella taiwanensis]MCD8458597.1 hypothetical protein [Xylella taiwanensis]MCD8460731.1 hypothetical protein [Xylella taiwanensis]